ncbi:MAG: hypothetical protein ACOYBY_14470 [Dermatophilaceae bacterium]
MNQTEPMSTTGSEGQPSAPAPESLSAARRALAEAFAALKVLPRLLWQAGRGELDVVLGEVDELAALAAAGRVAVTAEALERGEVAGSQCASTTAWVAAHAPSLAAGGAGQVAKLVEATRTAEMAAVRTAVIDAALPVATATVVLAEYRRLWDQVLPGARAAVLDGLIGIGCSHGPRAVRALRERLLAEFGDWDDRERAAARAAREVALSQPVAGDVDGVWDYVLRVDAEAKAILEAAIGALSAPMHTDEARDPRSTSQRRGQALIEVCRRVAAMAAAAGPYGRRPGDPPGAGEPNDVGRDRWTGNDVALGNGAGVTDAERVNVDRDGAGAGTVWTSHDDQAEPDCGSADRQHAETLSAERDAGERTSGPPHVDLCAPTAGDDSATAGGGVNDRGAGWLDPGAVAAALAGMGAGGAKAALMLTMPLTDLQAGTGAATVLGTTEADTLLTPAAARRIACDAGIVPVVLGTNGEVLDMGRTARLFTLAQAKTVLLRDRHCSFPGCDIPGFWCHLHHVRHWADGGLTDVANAGLLCARHHTIVHRDRLIAAVTPTGVRWDTGYGSYDRAHPNARDPAA